VSAGLLAAPPAPSFAHLRRLTDETGLFEHAEVLVPRRHHGYCVDDVARALVVVCREPVADPDLQGLSRLYLSFLLAAQVEDGRFRNRLDVDLRWADGPSVEDCWGRALWGLGAAVAAQPAAGLSADDRAGALAAFTRGARWRSPSPRAMAFAALGAAAVVAAHPAHAGARALLLAAAQRIGAVRPGAWPWPEDRLSYANGVLPEALLAAGVALEDDALVADGLSLLGWLLERETRDGHLSVTPVGGSGPGDVGPAFDQQPIEVAALADACARAAAVTGAPRWAEGVALAVGWFLGDNDAGIRLYDEVSGGGCDGLHPLRRNENQGAESTLAALSTLQHWRRLAR